MDEVFRTGGLGPGITRLRPRQRHETSDGDVQRIVRPDGGVPSDRHATFGPGAVRHEADLVDAVAGSEYVDDRLRLGD